MVFYRDAFADERVARNLAAPPDSRVLLNLDEGADLGLVPDPTPIEIDELPEPDVLAERDIRSDRKILISVRTGMRQQAPFPAITALGVERRIFRSVQRERVLA